MFFSVICTVESPTFLSIFTKKQENDENLGSR